MTSRIFEFGQTLPGYDVPVLNERAVRASAGILFFVAMVTFMQALLLGNFKPTQVFVVAFLSSLPSACLSTRVGPRP